MNEEDIKNLKRLMNALKADNLTADEFTKAFTLVIQRVSAMEQSVLERVDTKHSESADQIQTLIASAEKTIDDMKSANMSSMTALRQRAMESITGLFSRMQITKRFSAMQTEHDAKMAEVDDKLGSIDFEDMKAEVLAAVPAAIEKTPTQMRDGLETLTGDERLDKNAIKGLDDFMKSAGNKGGFVGGRSLLQLYVDGVKKGAIQYLNIIPGTGVSFTYSANNGRNDLTINAAASSAILTATGAIDDSNVTFTFTAQPSIIVINGASYRSTGGAITWSYLTGTVTLSSPVGSGGDIYGVA